MPGSFLSQWLIDLPFSVLVLSADWTAVSCLPQDQARHHKFHKAQSICKLLTRSWMPGRSLMVSLCRDVDGGVGVISLAAAAERGSAVRRRRRLIDGGEQHECS